MRSASPIGPRRALPRRRAWDPALLEPHEVSDIKAIAAQHPRGFDAIVRKLCRFYDVSFAAGGEDGRRESDYAEGKRAVAKNLLDLVEARLGAAGARSAPPDLPNAPLTPSAPTPTNEVIDG